MTTQTKKPKKAVKPKTPAKKAKKSEKDKESKKYFEAVGRRKRAIARVRIFACAPFEDKDGKIEINNKKYTDYLQSLELCHIVESALKKMKSLNRFVVTVKVKGGGTKGQAEAIRHALARALVKFNEDFRKKLKRSGYLKRDPRKIERKKPGLKKARRAPQWKKR
jgi:small subunit ribosomal protein S9